jgi:RHS repeat-associated protein
MLQTLADPCSTSAPSATSDIRYTRDGADNALTTFDAINSRTVSATYDQLGRPLTVSGDATGDPSTTYTYDFDNPTRTDPSGAYAIELDDYGRQASLTDPIHPDAPFTWAYAASGAVASVGDPTGNTTTNTYDPLGRLTARATTGATGCTNCATYALTYNRASNELTALSTITGATGNGTTALAYDALSRLTTYTPPAGLTSQQYTWNAFPDRASIKTGSANPITTTFDPANRAQSDGAGGTYAYDQEGRLTAMPGKILVWDALGRLVQVQNGSGVVQATYTYDALDRLRTVTEGGTSTRFRYVGLTTAMAQDVNNATGAVILNHATDLDGNDLLDFSSDGTTQRFLGRNAHTDVTWTSASTGAVTATAAYDPYGNVLASTGTVPNTRWQSSWQDASTGLYYVVARWYSPTLGSFLSLDPLSQSQLIPQLRDQYSYAGGDPMNSVDPDGRGPSNIFCGPDGIYCNQHNPYLPLQVPLFWQANPHKPWNHAFIGASSKHPAGCGQIMGLWPPRYKVGLGCAITALAMVFAFYGKLVPGHGVTDPGTLNSYLGANGLISLSGKNQCGVTNWRTIGRGFGLYISPKLGKMPAANWSVVLSHGWDRQVADQLRLRHPVIAQVAEPGMHFVVITALAADDFVINDPANKASTLFGSHRYTLVGIRNVHP